MSAARSLHVIAQNENFQLKANELAWCSSCLLASSIFTLSISKTTGADKMTVDVATIQTALRTNFTIAVHPLHDWSKAELNFSRALSGNISVSPHSLSDRVSSNSCKRQSKSQHANVSPLCDRIHVNRCIVHTMLYEPRQSRGHRSL